MNIKTSNKSKGKWASKRTYVLVKKYESLVYIRKRYLFGASVLLALFDYGETVLRTVLVDLSNK